MSTKKYVIPVISGGLGKCIVATSVIKSLKAAYPDKKIVFLSGYPEVFDNNPDVYRTFRFNENKYLYDEYIKDATLLTANPYDVDDYRDGTIHLAEAFARAWNCSYSGDPKPSLFIEDVLKEITKKEIFELRKRNKPVIVVQYIGQVFKDKETGVLLPSGRESLKLYEEMMNNLADKYTFIIMKRPAEPALQCDKAVTLGQEVHFMKWFGYIYNADGFIGLDSSGHHIAEAFGTPSVVTWARTNPVNLGYDDQKKVIGECEEGPCNGFISVPTNWKCPYNYKCAQSIDLNEFVEAINETFKDIKIPFVPPKQDQQAQGSCSPQGALPVPQPAQKQQSHS